MNLDKRRKGEQCFSSFVPARAKTGFVDVHDPMGQNLIWPCSRSFWILGKEIKQPQKSYYENEMCISNYGTRKKSDLTNGTGGMLRVSEAARRLQKSLCLVV
jgi:hypothetical protein